MRSPEARVERFADRDGAVLGAVVVVHVQVPFAGEFQVEAGVADKGGEHVVEEADAGADVGAPGAVEREGALDGGLSRAPGDGGGSRGHGHVSDVSTARSAAVRRSNDGA